MEVTRASACALALALGGCLGHETHTQHEVVARREIVPLTRPPGRVVLATQRLKGDALVGSVTAATPCPDLVERVTVDVVDVAHANDVALNGVCAAGFAILGALTLASYWSDPRECGAPDDDSCVDLRPMFGAGAAGVAVACGALAYAHLPVEKKSVKAVRVDQWPRAPVAALCDHQPVRDAKVQIVFRRGGEATTYTDDRGGYQLPLPTDRKEADSAFLYVDGEPVLRIGDIP